MRRSLLLALAAVTVGSGLARAGEADRLALAHKLMAQLHEDDSLRASLPLLTAQMRKTLAQQGQKDDQAEAFATRFKQRLGAEIGRYSDMMAEAYAQIFTEDELTAVIAFNATPLGQKFIVERPALIQASFLSMEKLGREVAEEVAEDLRASREQAPGKL